MTGQFQPRPHSGERAVRVIATEQTPEEELNLAEALIYADPNLLPEQHVDEVRKAFEEFLTKSSSRTGPHLGDVMDKYGESAQEVKRVKFLVENLHVISKNLTMTYLSDPLAAIGVILG